MLAKTPSWEAELSLLADEACETSRPALEAALREAFAAGWRAHAAAIAEFDNPPTILDTAEILGDERPEAVSSPSSPDSKSDIDMVFDTIKSRRGGRTSMDIITSVQDVNPDVSAAAVRTYLHRLKLRGQIFSRAGKWFPVPIGEGNVGGISPTHRSNELENTKMPPP